MDFSFLDTSLGAIDPDWDVDWKAPGALHTVQEAIAPKTPRELPPPKDENEYVRMVRFLMHRYQTGQTFFKIDWRLLAAGFGLVSPHYLARNIDSWLRYWEKAVRRPQLVGSPYNPNPQTVMKG